MALSTHAVYIMFELLVMMKAFVKVQISCTQQTVCQWLLIAATF